MRRRLSDRYRVECRVPLAGTRNVMRWVSITVCLTPDYAHAVAGALAAHGLDARAREIRAKATPMTDAEAHWLRRQDLTHRVERLDGEAWRVVHAACTWKRAARVWLDGFPRVRVSRCC